MSEYKLISEIMELSVSKNWDKAKLEWSLQDVYEAECPETCLCGHFPIIEICVLLNNQNSKQATVGNCCVKKFIGLPSDKIFQAVKRVRKNINKSLNTETIEHAYNRKWINTWENKFYLDIISKRNLSENQLSKKLQINNAILLNMRHFIPKNG